MATMKADISFLASDELQGRKSGTEHGKEASTYIAKRFKELEIKSFPKYNDYLQTFDFVDKIKHQGENLLILEDDNNNNATEFAIETEYFPTSYSGKGSASGRLIYLGYGIEAPELSFDELSDIALQDAVALIMRYSPDGENDDSSFRPYFDLIQRITNLKEKGVKALLVFSPKEPFDEDDVGGWREASNFGDVGIPVASVKRSSLQAALDNYSIDLDTLQKKINQDKKPQSQIIANASIKLTVNYQKLQNKSNNVIGYIKGSDPKLSNKYFVIGAHWDHLGLGGQSSLSLKTDQVHNGADDNASGIGALLYLAHKIKTSKPKHSIILAAFGAEELGVLGSAHFVKNNPVQLEDIEFMLNLDMIGRLRDKKLTAIGTGTSSRFAPIIQDIEKNWSDIIILSKYLLNTVG